MISGKMAYRDLGVHETLNTEKGTVEYESQQLLGS